MDLGLTGRNALVCGASKGLGLGCARALVREGANVTIVARSEDSLLRSADELRALGFAGTVSSVACDVTTSHGRERMFRDIGAAAYDILVTNAGGPPPGDFRAWDESDWLKAVSANMLTPIQLMKEMVDHMALRGFGRVVNITSMAVKAPISTLGLSNGARSGLTGFVAGLARSGLAARGVTINNLLPGYFSTERLLATFDFDAKSRNLESNAITESRLRSIPARRFGNADEFGEVCAFLCSTQASYLTGQNILLDGGAYSGTF